MSTIPIVQFGTSRFLQAHADLFVSEAMAHLGTHSEHDGKVFHLADPSPMKARDVLQLVSTAFDRQGAIASLPAPMIERFLARSKMVN